jgi:MoaA/NifB/PqqE/SkfB family radical SAM enzyme
MANQITSRVGIVVSGTEPKVTFRILHNCNFHCPKCSTFSGPNDNRRMSVSDFEGAIDILVENKFLGVVNLSGGETTLHPDLERMVGYAAGRLSESHLVVFTNGHWIGMPNWRNRLKGLLKHQNVLVRLSADWQHVEGEALRENESLSDEICSDIKCAQLERVKIFVNECESMKVVKNMNYDIAYKGTLEEAEEYFGKLWPLPVYLIEFQKHPRKRKQKFGYLAVDVDEKHSAEVFLTLAHFSKRDSLGGLEMLAEALKVNRGKLGKEN